MDSWAQASESSTNPWGKKNITSLLWALLTFSPSFLRAVRISIFCCVYTSRDSFPTMTSRSICAECHTLVGQIFRPRSPQINTKAWLSSRNKRALYNCALNKHNNHILDVAVQTSASLVLSCPGCFLAKSRITSGVLNAWLMAAWIAWWRQKHWKHFTNHCFYWIILNDLYLYLRIL